MQTEAKFLTIAQAAQFLKISPDTLRRWESKGIVTPQRTKGGSRRYTLLDLKIAKLNKRKTSIFQIPSLIKENYINSKRDLRVALFTSFLWVFGFLIYHFLSPVLLLPANAQQRILSDQLKETTGLKMASEIAPIKLGSTRVLALQPGNAYDKTTPEVSAVSNLLMGRSADLPSLQYTDSLDRYYSLQLPKNQIPTLIKRN